MFSRVILIILSLVAIGLYIRVILPPGESTSLGGHQSAPVAASEEKSTPVEAPARVPSSNSPGTGETAPAKEDTAAPEPLPAEQMRLVLEALAPELMHKEP